jgi:RNA polymerase sigma factor (sigma-70 family)
MAHSSDNISEVVKLKLRQFGLDKEEYGGLVRAADILAGADAEAQFYPQSSLELLVIRQIGAKIYYACQVLDDGFRNKAYSWLGSYLFSNVLKSLNGDRELAQDLMNTSLERIVLKINTCKMPTSFLTWAKTVAASQVAEYLRRYKPVNYLMEDEPNPVLSRFDEALEHIGATEEANPEKILLKKEQLEIILNKINSFKKTKRSAFYKAILLGTYFEDLDDQILAQRLNVPVIEIQKMRHQAIKVLQSDRAFIEQLR